MIKTYLTKNYPNLIQKVREWDCDYTTAMERIDREREGGTLKRFF